MKKTHWLRTTIIVLLVCGILGTALAAVLFNAEKGKPYASAALQFTFDGAASGLAPNRQAFRIGEMEQDQVLEAAIAEAGLAGTVTADQVRGCMTVRGVYPDDMLDQVMSFESLMDFTTNRTLNITEYHPTLFALKLVNGFEPALSQAQLTALRDGIITAYRAYFASRYAYVTDADTVDYHPESYDYPQQVAVITESVSQLARYAEELAVRAPAFIWNGLSFNDIAVRLWGLENTDAARLNAGIILNNLTRDEGRLLVQYRYELQRLETRLAQQKKRLAQLDKLVAAYEKSEIIYVSTSSAVQMIEGTSVSVYDRLVETRRKAAEEMTGIQAKIADYQLRIADVAGQPAEAAEEITAAELTAGDETAAAGAPAAQAETAETDTAAMTAALDQDIARLVEKRDAVAADFKGMLDAFNAQEINEGTIAVISRKYEAPGLLSVAFLKKIIMTAGPVCALGFMLCLVLLIRSRRKEEKLQA